MTGGIVTAVLCFAAGSALVLLEAILPGFGLPGISGAVLLCAGAACLAMAKGAAAALAVTSCLLLALGAAAILVLRAASKGKFSRTRLFLHATDVEEQRGASRQVTPGMRGSAASALRPAGIAVIGGARVNVTTQGEFIPAGCPVEVLHTEGNRVVVRQAEDSQP